MINTSNKFIDIYIFLTLSKSVLVNQSGKWTP